ncbi:MAG TPA: methyltransferase domain-containing protein [Candidatus Saccharimonadales bacterium]|nr:methyltransferase domain-containing protein [Candidatus Saccharimonadales bacterium]
MSIIKTAHRLTSLMHGPNPNDETIEAYNRRFGKYLKHTPAWYNESHRPLLNWIDFTLGTIPRDGKILEIGSGPGRDAKYMKEKGYHVICSDASYAFVSHLNHNGERAFLFNPLRDEISKPYHLIFANAVVPHFTAEDLQLVLGKVHSGLAAGGTFAFSAKQGEGEIWIDEKLGDKRYVHHWQPHELRKVVQEAGFEIIYMNHDIPGDLPTHTWILITARKTKN